MKIGIVGLGSIGKRHAINATKLGHDVHVYDPAVKGDFRFRHERDLYDWCDAAVIATPSLVHIAGIRACAERGRHMLVEKPIAVTDRSLRKMLDFAASKKLTVMVGNNLRFNPCVQKAQLWLKDIGKPLWAQFICGQASTKPLYLSDGVILNTGAHEVDMALYLLGPARAVMANAHLGLRPGTGDSDVNPMLRNCDDIADFMLLHDSGCRSTFHLDFVAPIPTREFRIIGGGGALYCDLIKRCLYRWQHDPKLPDVVHFNDYARPTHSLDDDYLDEMRAFIDRIEGKDVPGATGEDGFAALDILLEVRSKAGIAPR